jgi:hypothetical protein
MARYLNLEDEDISIGIFDVQPCINLSDVLENHLPLSLIRL